jgi:hypothetical protein
MIIATFFETTFTEVLGLFFSFLTLIFAFFIYRNFDLKKTHKNKQLDTLLELIQEINNTLVSVHFCSKIPEYVLSKHPDLAKKSKVTFDTWYFSLFRIGIVVNEKPKYERVFLTENIMETFPFLSYINNPLIPKSIANRLNNFYSPFVNFCSIENAPEKHVIIELRNELNKKAMYQYPDYIDAFKSWDSFIKCASELKVEIEKWLKKYGSKDINFNLYLQDKK